MLCAAFFGGVWRVYEYFAWLSLHDYTVNVSDPVLEKRFWDVFPSESLRFWPLFLDRAEGLKEFLERRMPVSVSTLMHGMGEFTTTLNWLVPWLKVEWQGRFWYVSKEGRMWDAADPDLFFPGKDVAIGPSWHLSLLSGDRRPLSAGVFPSPISFEKIEAFLDEYQRCPWFKYVKEIAWERRAGADLFRLNLVRGPQDFVILLQEDKYGRQELGGMLGDVLERLRKEGEHHMIDATYEGKIVLRALPAGAKEGSLK